MEDLGKLITLSIGISVPGFSFMLAALISMAKQLGKARASTERIAHSIERIVQIVDRDLQVIKEFLRGQ